MTGFTPLLRKDLREIIRTWRIWVVPLIVAFCALTGPLTARFLPEILSALAGEQAGAIVATLPEPSWTDAYAQWTKNLGQIVLIALVIVMASLISGEVRSGTAVMVLAKPVSRTAFVVARFTAAMVLVAGSVVAGALVTWGLTALVFDEAPILPLAGATGAWLVYAAVICAATAVGSAAFNAAAAGAGIGLGAIMILALTSMWQPAAQFSPAGLGALPDAVLAGLGTWWPVTTGAAAVVALVWTAATVFKRREL